MSIPKISVIIPVYNAEKYLCRCVDSILTQTFSNLDILLINDGSSDNSGTICDEYALKDNRIKVFHKNNGGVSDARNVGIDNASGEWITFVDADDWISHQTFQTCIGYLSDYELVRFSATMVFDPGLMKTKIININEHRKIKDYFDEIFSRRTLITVWGGIYKSDIVKKYNLSFDTNIKNGEDWLFLMQYSLNVSKIRVINTPLYYYNMYNVSSCIHTMSIDKLFESLIPFNRISEELRNRKEFQYSLINGKIAILGFMAIGFIWLNLEKKELLKSIERLHCIINPLPGQKDIWFSKQTFFYKVLISSLFNNVMIFQLMEFLYFIYKKRFTQFRIS